MNGCCFYSVAYFDGFYEGQVMSREKLHTFCHPGCQEVCDPLLIVRAYNHKIHSFFAMFLRTDTYSSIDSPDSWLRRLN